MSDGVNFFAELKRRHVYRVAVAYVVVGWLLIQFATQVFPVFSLPNWASELVVLFIAIGFPIALILAWAFEVTPDGIRRTEPADSPEARPAEQSHRVGQQLNRIIIAVMALVIALLLVDLFVTHKRTAKVTQAPAKSIAVLPFQNLSEDKSNQYFADGMQDMILTKLADIGDLKVISRTSTTRYASHPGDLKTIGQQLGVATILEGSVQKAGNQVLVNVQLIDADTDNHLWANAYTRSLDNIFGVEGEVAQKIADALKAKLNPQEAARVAAVPTTNTAAYDSYLRAMEHFNRAHDQDVLTATEMPKAIALFEQALTADPKFALADATLAEAQMRMYFYAPDRTESRLAAAKAAAENALQLQPGLGEAHFALALYHYWGRRDYQAATEQLQLAQASSPNNSDVALTLGAIGRREGRWDDAIAGFKRAALFDPRSSFPLDQLGLSYAALRRYADADAAFQQSVAVAPDAADERVTQAAMSVMWKGDLGPLRSALDALKVGSDAYAGNASSFYSYDWWSRDYLAAIKVALNDRADDWIDQGNLGLPRQLYLAWADQAAGQTDKARDLYSSVSKTITAALAKRPDDAELHLALALADAGLGLREDAQREGRRAAELLPVSRDQISGSGIQVWNAQLDVRVGDDDDAFARLLKAAAQPTGLVLSAALLKLDPVWDPLRKDPRFEQLLSALDGPVVLTQSP